MVVVLTMHRAHRTGTFVPVSSTFGWRHALLDCASVGPVVQALHGHLVVCA